MRYLAVAIDFDGTLARNDTVPEAAVAALQRLRTSGRRAILVTGRRVDHLLADCTCVGLFTRVVAENGAVLYNPKTRERTLLTDPLPTRLLDTLRDRGVDPLEIGPPDRQPPRREGRVGGRGRAAPLPAEDRHGPQEVEVGVVDGLLRRPGPAGKMTQLAPLRHRHKAQARDADLFRGGGREDAVDRHVAQSSELIHVRQCGVGRGSPDHVLHRLHTSAVLRMVGTSSNQG